MCHTHLPKLEERGIVETDRTRRRVRSGPDYEDVEPLLQFLDELPGQLA